MLNVSDLLEQIKQSPYREIEVKAPHTGEIAFADIKPGDKVHGPQGTWKEKPGTLLATLTRERNPKPIYAPEKGIVGAVHTELEKQFVECSTTLVTLRHHLTREEVENIILRKALYLFKAPERAKYYFTPEMAAKLRSHDPGSVYYSGPDGVIYATYFTPNDNVDADAPLIGVCPQEELPAIKEVIMHVQTEWQERS